MSAPPATEIGSPSFTAVLEAIRRRRSWKPAAMDPDREVPRELLALVLDAACWAPTHGMNEPWRFLVFTGRSRARLTAELPRVYDLVTPAAQVRPEKREKLGIVFLQAPVVIAIVRAHDPAGKIPEVEDTMAVACAVQNLHLCASAAGLAGMWSTPPLVYHDAVGPVLGLAADERCLGFFFLGWPKPGAAMPEGRRKPWTGQTRWMDADR